MRWPWSKQPPPPSEPPPHGDWLAAATLHAHVLVRLTQLARENPSHSQDLQCEMVVHALKLFDVTSRHRSDGRITPASFVEVGPEEQRLQ